MKYSKKNKGITLIALVITIIILLILAGITIGSLTGSGLFGKAKEAKEKSEQSQIKEEIEMAIMDIQIEEISKGNNVTLETLSSGQLSDKLEGIIATLNDDEINGEYKGYEYTIDNNLKVTVEGAIKGISFSYTLTPKGYTNGNIILAVNAESTNGNITNIEVNGLTQNEDGTFTITQNGEYQVTVTDSTGDAKTKKLNIQKIDTVAPTKAEVTIEDVKINGFTIKVKAEDGEATTNSVKSGIEKYVYKITGKEAYETTSAEYTVTNLKPGTEYTVEVVVYDKANNNLSSEPVIQETESITSSIYIDSINGNDEIGDGTQEKPFASLGKIAEEGIIQNGIVYNIYLQDGEYELTENIFELESNKEINIWGNKEKTILKVNSIYANRGGGSKDYEINLYRLIWKATTPATNAIATFTNIGCYNLVFDMDFPNCDYSYFVPFYSTVYNLENCTLPKYVTGVLRTTDGEINLTNCYGGFSSGWDTIDTSWNKKTNYITRTPKVNITTYRIIEEDENIWKNAGTGTNPDGTKANLGVYGGKYSWEY